MKKIFVIATFILSTQAYGMEKDGVTCTFPGMVEGFKKCIFQEMNNIVREQEANVIAGLALNELKQCSEKTPHEFHNVKVIKYLQDKNFMDQRGLIEWMVLDAIREWFKEKNIEQETKKIYEQN